MSRLRAFGVFCCLLGGYVLVGCVNDPVAPSPTQTATITPSATPSPTASPTPTAVPSPTPTVTPTPSDPFAGWRMTDLVARSYGGAGLHLLEGMIHEEHMTYPMRYPSDGLTISGLAHIPHGEGPFPVVVLLHGYFPRAQYQPGAGMQSIAAAFPGYVVLIPDYRGLGASDPGPNPFCIGYAIDVMNLIAQVGSIPQADAERIAVFGHSMGGGVALWPLILQPEVDAVVLYAPMHAEIGKNSAHLCTAGDYTAAEATAAYFGYSYEKPDDYVAASPTNYDEVTTPVLVHHGRLDESVPFDWSKDLVQALWLAGVDVTFYQYREGGHVLEGEDLGLLLGRTRAFLQRWLSE